MIKGLFLQSLKFRVSEHPHFQWLKWKRYFLKSHMISWIKFRPGSDKILSSVPSYLLIYLNNLLYLALVLFSQKLGVYQLFCFTDWDTDNFVMLNDILKVWETTYQILLCHSAFSATPHCVWQKWEERTGTPLILNVCVPLKSNQNQNKQNKKQAAFELP